MTPRGLRNNNPGNIRHSPIHWMGKSDEQPDKSFVHFESARYGIRALYKILLQYQRKHALDTIAEIINRWAPPVENDTGAYVAAVAKACGVEPDQPIKVSDRKLAPLLIKAIIKHENGQQPYADDDIEWAIAAAL